MLKTCHAAGDWPHPVKLFLEVTTRCNLKCEMCVKQTPDCGILSGDLSAATFEALEPALPGLDEVIIGGVGEPLLHPRLESFIIDMKRLLPPSGTVGLQTNGTLLTHERIEGLLSVDLDVICISVDAVEPDLLKAIRRGAHIDRLESSIRRVCDAKHQSCHPGPLVGIEFVLMRSNLHHLPQVIRWASGLGLDFVIVSHLLPFAAGLSEQAAYPLDSDAATQLFRKWREKICGEGLRIEDDPTVSMKYYKSRTADESRLLERVQDMKADGYGRDIPIDLKQLMVPRAKWVSRVDAIFEEALDIAQSAGMDLILPARQPRHTRHCSFVEEGSVFVAWDGTVSPCHFTWHSYACYPDGRKKTVNPLFFGNVESMPLVDIWNGEEFRSFRQRVRLYDYPYCGDCGLSPCDLIDATVFEHDCHTTTVPCCDCLWPTGVLNCLQ